MLSMPLLLDKQLKESFQKFDPITLILFSLLMHISESLNDCKSLIVNLIHHPGFARQFVADCINDFIMLHHCMNDRL